MEQKGVEEEEEQKCKAINNMWEVWKKMALLILKNLHTKEAIRFNNLIRALPLINITVLARDY